MHDDKTTNSFTHHMDGMRRATVLTTRYFGLWQWGAGREKDKRTGRRPPTPSAARLLAFLALFSALSNRTEPPSGVLSSSQPYVSPRPSDLQPRCPTGTAIMLVSSFDELLDALRKCWTRYRAFHGTEWHVAHCICCDGCSLSLRCSTQALPYNSSATTPNHAWPANNLNELLHSVIGHSLRRT